MTGGLLALKEKAMPQPSPQAHAKTPARFLFRKTGSPQTRMSAEANEQNTHPLAFVRFPKSEMNAHPKLSLVVHPEEMLDPSTSQSPLTMDGG